MVICVVESITNISHFGVGSDNSIMPLSLHINFMQEHTKEEERVTPVGSL